MIDGISLIEYNKIIINGMNKGTINLFERLSNPTRLADMFRYKKYIMKKYRNGEIEKSIFFNLREDTNNIIIMTKNINITAKI
jgi:hypothetical protein